MPDNVDITPGTGATVAADLVGGVLHQRVKLSVGADGVAADLAAGQALMAASLPVAIASNQSAIAVTVATVPSHAVTNAGTFATQEDGAALTALQLIDDVVFAEDAQHNSGDKGVMMLAVRQDAMAALAASTADYIPITTDANGQARVLVGCPDIVITVTPVLDTSAYASGDLLFDSTEIANAVRVVGGTAILQSITLLDKADQGVAFTLLFANAATDFGTLNAAPDPDDTEAGTVIGHFAVLAGDYVDLGANGVACIRNIGLLLKAGAATTSLYVAGINGTSTPTFAASDFILQLGLLGS